MEIVILEIAVLLQLFSELLIWKAIDKSWSLIRRLGFAINLKWKNKVYKIYQQNLFISLEKLMPKLQFYNLTKEQEIKWNREMNWERLVKEIRLTISLKNIRNFLVMTELWITRYVPHLELIRQSIQESKWGTFSQSLWIKQPWKTTPIPRWITFYYCKNFVFLFKLETT